jgi:hypothetical protein
MTQPDLPWHHGQTFSFDGVTWSVGDLWGLVESQAPISVSVSELPDFDARVWVKRLSNVTPEWILEHAQRILAADLEYPILVTPEGYVADGWHRLSKARIEGRKTILVLRLPDDFRSASTDPAGQAALATLRRLA